MNVLSLLRRALLPLTVAGVLAVGVLASERDASAQERRGYRAAPRHEVGHGGYGHGYAGYGRGYDWRPREYWGGRPWAVPGRGPMRRHWR
jgi:hypothetical protein